MSKSKGNVIDPVDIIQGSTVENLNNHIISYHKNGIIGEDEVQTALSGVNSMFQNGIPKCGADSLRFTLLSQKVKNPSINFKVKDCYANKLFCNKLWQATRFTIFWSEKLEINSRNYSPGLNKLILMEKWIVNRLSLMVDAVNKSLKTNEFHLGTTALKSFLYTDFCGVYIEYSKSVLKSDEVSQANICCEVLLFCLEISFRCLAPFMPHIAEILYGKLPIRKNDSVVKCTFPSDLQLNDNELDMEMKEILNISEAIRRMKSESSIKPVLVHLITTENKKLEEYKRPIQVLSRCLDINISNQFPSNLIHTNLIREIINQKTEVLLEFKEGLVLPSAAEVGPKKLKLQEQLDKLYKMRSDKGYENVLPEIQCAHSVKILKLSKKLKLLDELENNAKKNRKEPM